MSDPSSAATDGFATAPSTPSTVPHIHIAETDPFLEPPRTSLFNPSLRDSYAETSAPLSENNSTALLPAQPAATQEDKDERALISEKSPAAPRRARRRLFMLGGVTIVVIIIVLAVVLPVVFVVVKPKQAKHSTSDTSTNTGSPTGAISGGSGSQIIAADGTTFTYTNPFGGFWVSDPDHPFNNNAQPNTWTPPLNATWDFSSNRINGVNLGGWFVLEPFISPSLFQKYPSAVDEWTLSQAMAADTTASGGLSQIEQHYDTFITEEDFAQIAGAGLNWVRLPVPFWMIETWPGEPFLAQTSWKYILRAIGWARKYGLRVNLDLHTIPGSQNGYNHSGKLGQVDFMNAVMGLANAQRALEYIRVITEFFSQPQYLPVVPIFGIVNEALVETIGKDQITSFYQQAHNMIRGITGLGAENGPFISIHDGFQSITSWANFLPGSDRIMLDTHPYFAFDNNPNDSPIGDTTGDDAGGIWPSQACDAWANGMNQSRVDFGVTIAGEFSAGFNDCGLFLRGVNISTTYGGDCSDWMNAANFNSSTIDGLQQFVLAQMDSFGDYFYWTWKIGNSTSNMIESPLWSYQLGLQMGWIPSDPRTAVGKCASLGEAGTPFDGTFSAWQTGGAGAGTITGSASWPWPPLTISNVAGVPADATSLPLYAITGPIVSLPTQTLTTDAAGKTPTGIDVGSGWFNSQDTASAPTPVSGCSYPDAWDATDSPIPVPNCVTGVTLTTSFALSTPPPTTTQN